MNPFTLLSRFLIWSALPAAMLMAQPKSISSQAGPTRDHHLYVGAALFVQQDGELRPVKNIRGKEVLLESADARYQEMSDTGGISVQMTPKVSAISARIEDFEAQVDFTPDIDDMMRKSQLDLFMQGQVGLAEAEVQRLESISVIDTNQGDPNLSGDTSGGNAADANFDRMNTRLEGANESLEQIGELQEFTEWENTPAAENSDAGNTVKVTFRVSSDPPIEDAYAVATSRVLIKNRFHDLTFTRPIGRIDAKPRRVSLSRPKLPFGFEIVETKVYLFSNGLEIPTNRSEKQTSITRSEAREFVKLSHLGDNRQGATPAAPVWSLAPSAFWENADGGTLDHDLRVQIDPDGAPTLIESEGQIVPEVSREILAQMTFVPAIENGTPVPSTITVNLADFFRR